MGDEQAGQRTQLAAERTMLAWWRTALTALAVAVGVGRLLPELTNGEKHWPYAVIGLGFAVYGVALLSFGVARYGSPGERLPLPVALLAAGGLVLAIATAVLVVTG